MFVVHIGTSGFPVGNGAAMQRLRLTFKGLKIAGCNPLIISKQSVYKTESKKKLDRFQGLPYIATSMFLSRPENFLLRSFNKISGLIGELILLIKKRKKIHTAILSGVSVSELLYYRLLSKLLGFKLILHYVEFISAMNSRKSIRNYLNDKFLDNYSFFFCDGIIVISEFLKKQVVTKNKELPIIKIPAICDFDEFKVSKSIVQENHLMYCGSIGYFPVIEFVIDLYCKLREKKYYQGELLLAIGTSDKNSGAFDNLIKKIKSCTYSKSIIPKTNIPFNELINNYLASELLIVPLRNAKQDIAGFHHKVGEYCAAAKPIISTNLGEMSYYFKDGYSAILANEYTIQSFLDKLATVLPFKDQLNSIAIQGNKVGTQHLNYLTYGNKLKQFIFSL